MKYKLIGENNYFDINKIKKIIVKNRDIDNIEDFLNLNPKLTHWSKFDNINEAIQCLDMHVNNKSNILIWVDTDYDGISSASMLYKYLKIYDPNINLYLNTHKNKIHGITPKVIEFCKEKNINLLIVPDGGSNDIEEHFILKNSGIDIIVIDHHNIEETSNDAIIVNNQLSNVAVNLSGSGVMYKFLQALDEKWWMDSADYFLDLAGSGIVADSMDTRDAEIQYLVQKGLENINSIMLKHLIDIRYEVNIELNGISIGFYVAPYVNCLMRMGSLEEKMLLIEAFCDIDVDRNYEYTYKRGKNKGTTINENLYEHVVRICVSYKGKQDRLRDKCIKLLERQISEQSHSNILCLDYTNVYDDNGLSGLIANKISGEKQKPVLVFGFKDGQFKGSARGNLDNFKDIINKTDMFHFALGHQQAFGIGFYTKDLNDFKNKIKNIFKKYKIDKTYYVDFVIDYEDLDDILIQNLCSLSKFYGNTFTEPVVVIDNINIPTSVVNINEKGNMITINNEEKDTSLVKFKATMNEFENIVGWNESVKLKIIGKPSISEFNGNTYYQIVIDDYEILDSKETEVEDIEMEW